MAGYHAKLSPSSAHRWSSCTASVGAQEGTPNEGSEPARVGTTGHQMLEELLTGAVADPQTYLGRKFIFWDHQESDSRGEDWLEAFGDNPDRDGVEFLHEVEVTQDLIDAVVSAYQFVLQQAALTGGEVLAEQQVPIGHITAEAGARGTSDVVILTHDTIAVWDLKLGRGRVEAYDVIEEAHADMITGKPVAEVVRPNLQLAMYALGALELHGLLHDFKFVKLGIIQPFLDHVSEWSGTVEELKAVGVYLSAKAEETRTNPVFVPSNDNCHFCRAKGNCDAQTEMAMNLALEGFDSQEPAPRQTPDSQLGQAYAMLPLVRDWVDAIDVRVREKLNAGMPVLRADGLGYKLVAGKRGARTWTNEQEAEAALQRMRLKREQMYKQKLISPTDAEKLATPKKAKKGQDPLPAELGPTQWRRLQQFITQSDGGPVIALETDPRPALPSATNGFEDVPPADNSDLF